MPAERIRNLPFDVRISWGRDTEVQLGIGEHEDRSLLWVLFGNEAGRQRWVRKIEAHFAAIIRADTNFLDSDSVYQFYDDLACTILNTIESEIAGATEYSSVWATLDRTDVNQLIRILRRARDQAFGKDE